MDHVSASQVAPMYCMRTQDWHEPWAQHVAPGLDLPRLRWAGDAAGALTARAAAEVPGLRAGIPVITGTIDAWAESVSVDATRPGEVMLMYGTTAFLVATTRSAVPSRTLWAASGTGPGTFTISGGMSTSGAITGWLRELDRKSTRLNSSHVAISYAVFCLKKKTK